jgi:hypothetical protein
MLAQALRICAATRSWLPLRDEQEKLDGRAPRVLLGDQASGCLGADCPKTIVRETPVARLGNFRDVWARDVTLAVYGPM